VARGHSLAIEGRLIMRRLKNYLEFVYIFLVNLPYLGKPSADKIQFVLSTYRQAFGRDLDYLDKLFYYLYGNQLILIHEVEGEKAGFSLFRIKPFWELHCVYMAIEQSYQKKGEGSKFVAYVLNYWKQKGFKTMSAYIFNHNLVSIRLFTLHGFKLMKSERHRGYYVKYFNYGNSLCSQFEKVENL
jgi:GNAT superfamily N-acetyltransferase